MPGHGGGCDMTIDLTDTTTSAIHDALRQARLRLGGVASGMVLTLVIVTDEGAQYDAVRAASAAGRQHPCRILVVIILLPDTPVVTWWPDIVPPIPAQDPMGVLAQRRITDAAGSDSPREVLSILA